MDRSSKDFPNVKSKSAPITAQDFLETLDGVPNIYNTSTPETSREGVFDPKQFPHIRGASYYDDPARLRKVDAASQGLGEKLANTGIQFGANFTSALGQGLANTFDLLSTAKSIKGAISGGDDDFNSSLFGMSTKEMQEWANNIIKNHQIAEKNPGEFSPSDTSWWLNQFASAGTGIGMAVEALGTTAAIEYVTGGMGTAAVLAKLGNLTKKFGKTIKGTEALLEAVSDTKGLRSAATMYGVISRLSESRMEASNNYDQIYQDLSQQTKEDGSPKYTDKEAKTLASQGARRTMSWNLALLPLDILSYRAMVFNPISGTGEGIVERGLSKLAGIYGTSTLGKTAGWLTTKAIGANIEGIEEGFQYIGESEGKHYAKVLSGQEDGQSFLDRLYKDVQSDEFWNNYAGGVIGSPIIGGAMELLDRTLHGRANKRLADIHSNYITEVGAMDSAIATRIKDYEKEGKSEEAAILRRQFGANKAISALHLDGLTNKNTAFDSRLTFLSGVLGEINEGKTTALQDLGFNNVTPEQVKTIKAEFEQYIADAASIKKIYDEVKYKYNKNFVPEITQDHFQLQRLSDEKTKLDNEIVAAQNSLFQYGSLSANGKIVFNAEYKLRALQEESNRLQQLARNPKDSFEQANINRQLEENKAKIKLAEEEVRNLDTIESYTPEQKKIDKEIIESSIINSDYLQAIYDREHLENAIALQRKNIALWNNPDYQKSKTEKTVDKAKTKEQVNTVVEGTKDTAIQQKAEQKKNEIGAKEAAQQVAQDQTIGNSDLFSEDLADANDILATSAITNDLATTAVPEGELGGQEFLFSPATYDFKNSSDEAKNKIKIAVGNILTRLGQNPTFEDLVRQIVKVKGLDEADKMYNALIYGWEANNKLPVDYQMIYDSVFGNPYDDLVAASSQLRLQTQAELEKATDKVTTTVVATQNKPIGFDNNNQPLYKYTGIITNESSPKFAFVSRLTNTLLSKDDSGNIVVDREYSEDELNTHDIVDSIKLLDPDKFLQGTQVVAKVPANFNEIKILIYDDLGNKLRTVTFGQYVAENKLTPDMQEYKDRVPIIIYENENSQRGVAFVHDVNWYHPVRFNQVFKEDMINAINHTRAIRNEVLGATGATKLTITGKRQTTFAGLKTNNRELISLREANPQTQLTIAKGDGLTLYSGKTEKLFEGTNKTLANTEPFNSGDIVDVRRYGKNESIDTYIGFPVFKGKLDDISRESVVQAITIYASRSNTNPAIRQKHDAVVKMIREQMGLDILNNKGLEEYLSHFIATFNTEKAFKNSDVELQAKSKLAPETPYIAFIAGGNIVFGQAGVKQTTTISSYFINPSMANNSIGLSGLSKPITVKGQQFPSILHWYEQNLNIEQHARNKPVVGINKDNIASIIAPSYNDHLLDRLRTNMRSVNIGTKESPNYVTNIQPVITYDTNKRLEQATHVPTIEEIKQEVVPKQETKSEIKENPNATELDALVRAAMEKAQKELGTDFGNTANNIAFSPAVLTEEQRDYVASNINRIAGLTPNQQFDITDFLYNQIVPLIDANGGIISIDEVNKRVDEAFNAVVKPLKSSYLATIKEYQALLNQFPELSDRGFPALIADYQYRVGKIQAIEDNYDVLKEEARRRVDKYTNINVGRIETQEDTIEQNEENEDDTYTDEQDQINDTDAGFWTEALQESPENKLTYTLRRFFGQILRKDKNGVEVKGFLGLPTYESSDDIIRKLMVTLADVPSDFETMLAKIEERKAALPWVTDVVAKLRAASEEKKNQFVTVMSNTSLRMKFTMISFNRRNNNWTTKLYDTNLSGVADAVKAEWKDNLMFGHLVLSDEEGNHSLNVTRAQKLIDTFRTWRGHNINTIVAPEELWDTTVSKVKSGKPLTFEPTGIFRQDIERNISTASDRVRFSMRGREFQITKVQGNTYQIGRLDKTGASKEDVTNWLKELGITLSPQTIDELYDKGLVHNKGLREWNDLFQDGTNTNGLFGILYNRLVNLVNKGGVLFDEEGGNPLEDSVVDSLANLEAKYNDTSTPFGFRDNGKSLFALTAPKFITDRVRDLKTNENIRKQLKQVSFSQNSFWLRMLDDENFRNRFGVAHIGLNAFKELGKKIFRDNGITKLSDLDHELTKLGMFWDMTQGEISSNYGATDVKMRMATMFSPTMSDKQLMTLVTTAVLDLKNADLNDGKGPNKQVLNILYEQLVKPELARMIKFAQNGSKTNIKDYDKGAGMFMLLPNLNLIEYSTELKLVDAIKQQPNVFTLQYIESNETLMNGFYDKINSYIKTLVDEKLDVWQRNGIINLNLEDGAKSELKFFDNRYITSSGKFTGDNTAKARMAAMDFVINSMIANSNSFMTMIGDPALYFKSKSSDPIIRAQESFINVGKRLANQIAPGTAIANSQNEKYIQIFLQDRKSVANNIEYLEQILGVEGAKPYRNIEASDAQEYTTWKEHLNILSKMGKVPDTLMDITPQEIEEARDLFASGVKKKDLTEKQRQLLSKVVQPIKPVYTGQVYDKDQDVMRTVYIKSSSFPLIPQLTEGFELDKLRIAMEKVEKNQQKFVRASYQSANKVGALSNPVDIWKEDGTAIDDINAIDWNSHSLILDRSNFRIQQDVPFKTGKNKEDTVTLGTQLMKLLFGDEVLDYNGYMYNGQSHTGDSLYKKYNDTFISLVQEKRNQLFYELGLDNQGNPIDTTVTVNRLQDLLKEEAIKRGYPLQDIEGLNIVNGQFVLPLWASSNSNRYESMLNAIISNRLIRMKMPGNSYVVGSEEGFNKPALQEGLEGIDQSKIIFTSAWNGKELQNTITEDGKVKYAQVFAASKFRDNEGNLVDLFTKENGEYKYVKSENGTFILKSEMFDNDLLSYMSFRIPSSGLQSGSVIEIAGFLPYQNADLMIVPKNFTKQKGLDFDVDKENSYQLWHRMNAEGKFEVLNEKHKLEILTQAEADRANNVKLEKLRQEYKEATTPTAKKYVMSKIKEELAKQKFEQAILGDLTITEDDIENSSKKLASKITEKLAQNELIKIKKAVYSNPNSNIQAKIVKTLNTDYAEAEATEIDKLVNQSIDHTNWTALSDEYQKQKMMSGASGKIGTGAYSLDVVFHSLVQQANIKGKPITLVEMIEDEEGKTTAIPKIWRFANSKSTGILGGRKTLDGGRTISEVMAERQNIAVDNEKLQVMGRVNLNDLTLDVDKVFNLLGFDKGSDGHDIAFLFLSQPILKEFVLEMKNANANMASEFVLDKQSAVVEKLINKYGGAEEVAIDGIKENYEETVSDLMTNDNFKNNISGQVSNQLQRAVLRRFIEMKSYGEAIRGVQVAMNTDSRGLGKSFFDVIEKKAALNRLGGNTNLLQGTSGLIGEYLPKQDLGTNEKQELLNTGYVDIGNFLVKPDTLSGGFSVYGIMTAYNLWGKYLPYDSMVAAKIFDELLPIIGSGDNMGDTKKIQLKQEIFKHMKKYFSASKMNGIISNTDDINEERKRLFIDSSTNTSLASYLKALRNTVDNPVVKTFIQTNKLINRFEFQIEKNGQPSLIKYNNAAGEEFDEQYLYESIATLIEVNKELPEFNGKPYTTAQLAQDLAAYSMLGNSTQEAIQFTKYIPVSYLNAVGYSGRMRAAHLQFRENLNILGAKVQGEPNEAIKNRHLVSEFTMQFVQHNPERLKGVSKLNFKELQSRVTPTAGSTFKDLKTFLPKTEERPTFYAIYNPTIPKGEKKFDLYWFDGKHYTKIPVLGTFGMDEYQPRNEIGTSLVNGRLKVKIDPQSQVNPPINQEADVFDINSSSIETVIDNIVKADLGAISLLAKALRPHVNSSTSIEFADQVGNAQIFKGLYNSDGRHIYISPTQTNVLGNTGIAQIIMHEVVHDITWNEVRKYVDTNAQGEANVKANAPAYISNLVRLFNDVRSRVDTVELQKILAIVRQGKEPITDQEYKQKYGLTNLDEFITMSLTEPEFQKYLASNQFKQSGQTLLDRFKEIINSLLASIGVKFDSNTATAQAIDSIFTLIESSNKSENLSNPNEEQADSSYNDERFFEDEFTSDNFDEFLGEQETGEEFSPATFPDKQLIIKDEKCL